MFYTAPTKRRPQDLLRYGRNSALIPRAHSKVSKPIIPRRLTSRKHLLNKPTCDSDSGEAVVISTANERYVKVWSIKAGAGSDGRWGGWISCQGPWRYGPPRWEDLSASARQKLTMVQAPVRGSAEGVSNSA